MGIRVERVTQTAALRRRRGRRCFQVTADLMCALRVATWAKDGVCHVKRDIMYDVYVSYAVVALYNYAGVILKSHKECLETSRA